VLVEKDMSPGMLKFEKERLYVKESQGQILIKIQRVGGSTGKVKCRLHTKDVTAIAPKDYQARDELVLLQDGQTETSVPITIMDDDQYEVDETFQVILSEVQPHPRTYSRMPAHPHTRTPAHPHTRTPAHPHPHTRIKLIPAHAHTRTRARVQQHTAARQCAARTDVRCLPARVWFAHSPKVA
jgi:hypothetical protein